MGSDSILSGPRVWLTAVAIILSAPTSRAFDPLSNPNASPQARALLAYMESINGTKILSGQQEFPTWPWNDADEDEIEYIQRVTGKTPAIRGFDLLFYTYSEDGRQQMQVTERAIDWARAGGIVTMGCHMFVETNSVGGPAFYVQSAAGSGAYTNFDIRQAVIEGTPENTELLEKFDILAAELTKLRDAHVPVIWRPFHENSGGWFWWGAHGSAPLITAWRMMYDLFTQTYGLDNLIWEFNPGRTSDLATWYPGDAYVDMVSLDVYPNSGHPSYATDYETFHDFVGGRKLVALSENGAIPDPDLLVAQGAKWAYFCTWDRTFITADTPNALDFKQTVFTHDYVLTREELPKVYLWGRAPQFTQQPESQVVDPGADLSLTAEADANESFTYQWYRNGVALEGETTSTLDLTNLQPGDATTYTVRATSSLGTTSSNAAAIVVGPRTGRLANLSTRGLVGTNDNVMIVGFVVGGTTPRTLLVRAVGPGLVPFGIPENTVLSNPHMNVYQASTIIMTNDDWETQLDALPDVAPVAGSVGAFPLDSGSTDSALVGVFEPGAYTAVVSGTAAASGVGLIELYDAGGNDATSRLVNISTRGLVGSGNAIMIPGIVVSKAGRRLLIRGVGPGLAGIVSSPVLPDPVLHVVDQNGIDILVNDDWGSATSAPAVKAAFVETGAFNLDDDSKDAAVVIDLPPGLFTALVSDKNGESGVALVEVYEMAP